MVTGRMEDFVAHVMRRMSPIGLAREDQIFSKMTITLGELTRHVENGQQFYIGFRVEVETVQGAKLIGVGSTFNEAIESIIKTMSFHYLFADPNVSI